MQLDLVIRRKINMIIDDRHAWDFKIAFYLEKAGLFLQRKRLYYCGV